MVFSFSRTITLCKKEGRQIIRDPSTILIAVVIPLMLLFIFGYGINLDTNKIRIGVLVEQHNQYSHNFIDVLQGSPYITPIVGTHRAQLNDKINSGEIRGIVVIPTNFAQQMANNNATIQLITDGSEPNIANFVQGYMTGAWQTWLQQQSQDTASTPHANFALESRYWFNSAAISKQYILPGAITIIMTVIGSILTSLVIAREWERGTMEALLSTPITKLELLISKLLPYYLLAIVALVVCLVVTVFIMHVPFRGSLLLLFMISSLFLFTILSIGLLISTLTRNQFNAAMLAINAAFLPAIMLSGFVFEIDSMPAIIQLVTYIIPARYYVNTLQTLFLAGNTFSILIVNAGFLLTVMSLLLIVIIRKTKLDLE
ncbi:ABC transporter permease [Orbus sturtevantii]|uniref:ABC transporter permease n=1 Tax=Orbus sturtevantii TaxID=3074109 RepID=UPI00370D2261